MIAGIGMIVVSMGRAEYRGTDETEPLTHALQQSLR